MKYYHTPKQPTKVLGVLLTVTGVPIPLAEPSKDGNVGIMSKGSLMGIMW